jgi:RHS repeat-associated protein
MDEMVLETQQWLNKTYGNDSRFNRVSENGRTGWETVYGLTRALQIEEGIQETSDNFGPTTMRLCPTLSIESEDASPSNYNYILQGAFWCKGYSAGGFTGVFYKGTQAAAMQFEADAGLSPTGVVTPMIMKALLNMDAFVLVDGGDTRIRAMQQRLNRLYNSYFGLMPCDGRYARETNTALVYALQSEEGMDTDTANGYFGNGTTSKCPTLSPGDSRTNFVYILQYALYCNGFDPGSFNGSYGTSVQSAVESYQRFTCLPVTGIANMPTIKALLASCGDINRAATGCDCATILTAAKAATLKNNGYTFVGRYLTGTIGGGVSKALSSQEVQVILDAGLQIFPIFETSGYYIDYFTPSQGNQDAKDAMDASYNLGIPHGATIYFAVDFDAYDYQVTDTIVPYFRAIESRFSSYGDPYRIGVYGPRNICLRVAEAGISVNSFVGDMSTGYSGNLGYRLPRDWTFDQITTITLGSGDGEIEIDKDVASNRGAPSSIVNYVEVTAATATKCFSASPNPTAVKVSDPIDSSSGAHTISLVPLTVKGAIDFSFQLNYNSSKLVSGNIGKGWYHNYEMKLATVDNAVYLYRTPSEYVPFTLKDSSTNTYGCNVRGMQNDILTKNADGSYLLNRNNDVKYSFTAEGVLTNIQNHMGMSLTLSHTTNLLVIAEPISGKSITASFNTSGLISAVSDLQGNTVSLEYDTNARMTTLTDANKQKITYTYDSDGRILTGTDGDSICYFTNTYDGLGRVSTQTDANGKKTSFQYDDTSTNGQTVVTITDRNGNSYKNTFNSLRQLISTVDANGNQEIYTYDANGNIASETNALSYTKATTYDAENHPTEQSDEMGLKTEKSYDSQGNLLKQTNPDGSTITYTYDTQNRPISMTDSRGTVTTFVYDSNGLLTEKSVGTRKFSYIYTNGMLAKATAPDGGITAYTYDQAGRVLTQADAKGDVTTYTYDGNGNVLSETNPLKNAVTYTYNSRGKVLTKTDARGNVTKYQYNGNGKTVSITGPKKDSTTYGYDGEDRLISTTDANGNIVKSIYDAAGRVTKKTDALGKITEFTYDAAGNILTQTNPNGGIVKRTYYPGGKLKTETNAMSGTTTYVYDNGRRISKTTNALGNDTNYAYSSAGDLMNVTDPLGNKTSYTYDAFGNMLTKTDPNGNVTTYAYDANNNRISMKDALGNVTKYTYDALNRLIATTDANGNAVKVSYDALGHTIAQTDALGNTTTMVYDPNGNETQRSDALGNIVKQSTFDAADLPLTVQDALGNQTASTYDAMGNLIQSNEPMNNPTKFTYDAGNRMTGSTDALSGTSSLAFDADGNKISVTNPLGGVMKSTYDLGDRLTSETTTSGGTVQYGYNAASLISELTNARGQKREYSFDDAGRIKSFTDPEGTTSYAYDANGNIITVNDASGTITRQYDALNRVVKVTDTVGNIVKYTYDTVGNLSSLTYPDGKMVSYSYDADNRLTAVTDWAKRVTSYSYDANGRLVKTVRSDGSVLTQAYDKAGYLISAVDKDASGNIISSYTYSYDANGNILTENSTTSGTDNAAMVYDVLNRLTSKSDKDTSGAALASYAYAYDADGNITSGKSAQQTAAMTYDVLDRLSAYNGNNPAFDLDGNLTSCTLGGSVVSFVYDSGNRLTQAGTATYTYDANDNRTASAVGGKKTQYAYENTAAKLSQLLVRTNPDGSQTFYVYGLGLIGQQDSTGYSVYHFDFRGSTVALTNSSGAVADRFTYGAYGELLTHTGSSDTPFLYNGRDGVLTDANGLYYMRARYYSPELKRFLNADSKKGSIDKIQTLNLYSFVIGNPLSLIDPAGMSADNWLDDLSRIGASITGSLLEVAEKIFGSRTVKSNTYIDEQHIIRWVPGEGIKFSRFPRITKVLGKISAGFTVATTSYDILSTWTENSGNTDEQRLGKTGIQLGGAALSYAAGVGGGIIIAAGLAAGPIGAILGIALGISFMVSSDSVISQIQDELYQNYDIR